MAILDIRKEQEEEITGIKFDDSDDVIGWEKDGIIFIQDGVTWILCLHKDVDNFITALHKAKELAGK